MATITANRPDVVAAVIDKIKAPVGYIGHRFFPTVRVAEKVGDLFVKTLDADSEAEARTGETDNFTRSTVGDKTVSYSCAEKSKTYQIPETREKSYGSIDKVDQVGVTAAGRSVLRKFEGDSATAILTDTKYSAATALKDGLALYGIQNAALSIGRYAGKTVLAGGTTFFQNLLLSADVAKRLDAVLGGSFTSAYLADVLGGKPEVLTNLLRAFMPVDEVLVGDNEFWAPAGKTDVGIVARIPSLDQVADPEEFDMLMSSEPVLGAAPWFMPDPEDPRIFFGCRSFFDENNDCDVYKAKGWYDIKVLNDGAYSLLKFTADPLTTTTTTVSN